MESEGSLPHSQEPVTEILSTEIVKVYTIIHIFKTLMEHVSSLECNMISGDLEIIQVAMQL
jgi:hypothetical protein